MPRKQSLILSIVAAVFLIVSLAAHAFAAVKDPAKGWADHFNTWFVISAGIWLIVTVPLVYFIFRYRRKRAEEEGADIHGNTLLEIVWTAIPLVIVILLGVQTWALYTDYRDVPQNAYEVKIEGYQYGYDITYPEGIKTVNELRVPVGPVKTILTSRDVIHTFSIPKYRVKEDMIPGRMTYMWFNAKEPGEYPVFCSELCGPGHSLMLAKVIAMKKEDFDAWVAKQKTPTAASLEERGKELVKPCIGCHTITGEPGAGPTFKGIFGKETVLADGTKVKVDDAYIKESLLDPKKKVTKGYPAIMPPYTMSDEEIKAMVAYLKTVK